MVEPVYPLPLPDPAAQVTELRIHGVSGPDPATILEAPAVFHVAGDALTGFARRRSMDAFGPADVGGPRQLEAFSWRGVSSGTASRALWLLLAPFAFVNFAAWMHPIPADPERPGHPRRDPWNDSTVTIFHALLRMLALTLTTSFAFTINAAVVAIPLQGLHSCPSWLAGCRSAVRDVGPLLALASLALLALLGRSSYRRYDRSSNTDLVPGYSDDVPETVSSPLELRSFWDTKQSVRRQFLLHAAACLATFAWVEVHLHAGHLTAWRWGFLVLGASLLVAAGSPWSSMARDLGSPTAAPRSVVASPAPAAPEDGIIDGVTGTAVVRFLALRLGLPLAAVALVVWRWSTWTTAGDLTITSTSTIPPRPEDADLIGMLPAFTVLVGVALVILLGVLLTIRALRADAVDNVHHRAMLGGNAGWLVPLVAWEIGGFLSAAVLFAVNKLFHTDAHHVATPGVSTLVNTGAFCVPIGVLATLALVGCRIQWTTAFLSPALVTARIRRPDRVKGYRKTCGTAYAVRTGYWAFVPLAVSAAAWLLWSTLALATADLGWTWPSALRYVGVPPKAGLPLAAFALLATAVPLAVQALLKTVGARRGVGVIWDVVTFWPRAAHPFGPPCYAERAVPQLRARHAAMTSQGASVLVSGHSQGAVISAALLLQMRRPEYESTALVTYGCQYSFLFARGFPAYLGGHVLDELAFRLDVGKPRQRWLNLYRQTDYLGAPVHLSQDYPGLNREVADPSYARTSPPAADSLQRLDPGGGVSAAYDDLPGDLITQEAALRHSDYPASQEYRRSVRALESALAEPIQG